MNCITETGISLSIIIPYYINIVLPSDLDNIFKHLYKGGLVFIDEPNKDSQFGNPKLNTDKKLRNDKLMEIMNARKQIKHFIKSKKLTILNEADLPIKYILLIKNNI